MPDLSATNIVVQAGGYLTIIPSGGTSESEGTSRWYVDASGDFILEMKVDGSWEEQERYSK